MMMIINHMIVWHCRNEKSAPQDLNPFAFNWTLFIITTYPFYINITECVAVLQTIININYYFIFRTRFIRHHCSLYCLLNSSSVIRAPFFPLRMNATPMEMHFNSYPQSVQIIYVLSEKEKHGAKIQQHEK